MGEPRRIRAAPGDQPGVGLEIIVDIGDLEGGKHLVRIGCLCALGRRCRRQGCRVIHRPDIDGHGKAVTDIIVTSRIDKLETKAGIAVAVVILHRLENQGGDFCRGQAKRVIGDILRADGDLRTAAGERQRASGRHRGDDHMGNGMAIRQRDLAGKVVHREEGGVIILGNRLLLITATGLVIDTVDIDYQLLRIAAVGAVADDDRNRLPDALAVTKAVHITIGVIKVECVAAVAVDIQRAMRHIPRLEGEVRRLAIVNAGRRTAGIAGRAGRPRRVDRIADTAAGGGCGHLNRHAEPAGEQVARIIIPVDVAHIDLSGDRRGVAVLPLVDLLSGDRINDRLVIHAVDGDVEGAAVAVGIPVIHPHGDALGQRLSRIQPVDIAVGVVDLECVGAVTVDIQRAMRHVPGPEHKVRRLAGMRP